MTDKMLSAEKLAIVLNGLDLAAGGHPVTKFREGAARVINHLREEINSGELDAGCPKCGACGRKSGAPPIDWSKCICSGGTQPVRACPIHGDNGPFSRERCPYCGAGTGGSEK